MKKIKKYICYLIILSNIFVLSGCSNNNDEELLVSKLESEMQYFDSIISDMLNNANGINFQNYQVSSEKIEEQPSQGESSQGAQTTGSSSQSQSSEVQQSSGEDQQSSPGGNSSSQKGGSSSGSGSQTGQQQNQQNNVKYELVENNSLTNERTTNWDELTNSVENIYSDWSIVTLDLYKKNVDSQKILNFNTDLDNLTTAIKAKDKPQTLLLLAKVYSYIPTYSADFSDDQMQINLYRVKSNIFNAYSIIEQNNPEEVKKQLQLAEESIVAMMNNMGNNNQKEYNINKAYILLKDMQNTIDKKDIDIFYLKYKNLIEELNVL